MSATLPKMTLLAGDALAELRELPEGSVQCCVTSPPYWGLRDYGVPAQLGLERTPEDYVAAMVAVFREVRRVLRADGTCWVNLGDSYATGAGAVGECPGGGEQGARWKGGRNGHEGKHAYSEAARGVGPQTQPNRMPIAGLKPKDLVGIPWRVAFALQADGWWLRSDIIWHKPNPMPESIADRPTKAHEYLFLLTKSARYFYDAEAIKEESVFEPKANGPNSRMEKERAFNREDSKRRPSRASVKRGEFAEKTNALADREAFRAMTFTRNKRSVWTVASAPYREAHFATYPPALIRPCILAGSRVGDVVLDPFAGSGTTGMVALELGRSALLIELNPEYRKLIAKRCDVTPGLPFPAAA